jgi:pyruvate dehydrogenase E1 component alpha subunit
MDKWSEERPEEDYYQVLSPDGKLQTDAPISDTEELLRIYQSFVITRTFEEKLLQLQRQGEISIVARSLGEEATPLGSSAALEPGDWCFPAYRQLAAKAYWDVPLNRMVAGLMGFEPETISNHLPISEDESPPINFTPSYVPLAANIPNAVGSALVDKLNDNSAVTLTYLGEGSTSEGGFHEALNFAGVFDVPAVIICQNNQWAISVPAHRQTAADTFAQKAEAHGVPHERVDGNDIFAVYERTREAVKQARSGNGPTFIECVTYRMTEHNTADEASVYRDPNEREYWEGRDPVERFEKYLRSKDILDEETKERIQNEADESVTNAVEQARDVPPSDPEMMFNNHLSDANWKERRQRAELRAEQEGGNPFLEASEVWR